MRGPCTRRTCPCDFLSQLVDHYTLNHLLVKRHFWLEYFSAFNVNAMRGNQFSEQSGMRDTSGTLADGVGDVVLNPLTDVDLFPIRIA